MHKKPVNIIFKKYLYGKNIVLNINIAKIIVNFLFAHNNIITQFKT